MKHILGLFVLFGSLSGLTSASVVTSTNCTASDPLGAGTVTQSASSCGARAPSVNPQIISSATISNTQTLSANSFTSSFTLNVSVSGAADNIGIGTASATGMNSEVFNTAGPVRSGVLVLTANNNGDGIVTTDNWLTQIGSFSQTCSQSTPLPTATCNVAPTNGVGNVNIPITLGQSLSFLQTVSSNTSGGAGSIPHFGTTTGSITISAFESNGTTPVALQAVPEPASLFLIGCGLTLAAVARKRMQR